MSFRLVDCGSRVWRQSWLAVGFTLFLQSTLAAAVKSEPTPRTPSPASPAPTYNLRQVEFINGQIRQGWESHGLIPSELAPDNEWCRRVFLDVLGRVPTVGELQKFLADPSPDKRAKLVNRLLGDEYTEDYAHNWTALWTNILIGRKGGTEKKTLISRDGLKQSLRRALERNIPYDKLVYDLVSATGRSKPGEENFNGLVNFLGGNMADNGVEATAKTAQIFLGVQVRCTQCHNHPFNEYKQNQFWEMNAFFRQTRVDRTRGDKKKDTEYIDLVNRDFSGEDKRPQEAALFYELRNGKMSVAYPVFLDGTKLKTDSGYLGEVDRRTELARMMIKSDYLGRAIANRYWAHFLGYGFTKPVDDIGPHNVPSHPDLLEGLAKEIKTHSYDLKQLIRWIVLSEPYSLSSHLHETNYKDDPLLGEKPMFSHFYLRQMRAEELFESLLVATEAEKTRAKRDEQEDLKNKWLGQFTIAFGTDENDETTTFNGTITQALMMMNGELVANAINIEKHSFLHRIAANSGLSNAAKITYLYEAAVARKPTSGETSHANRLLSLRGGNAAAALQDVWWALLNSNEFILNH